MRAPALAAALALLLVPAGCRKQRPRLERGDAAVVVRKSTTPLPEGLTAVPEREPAGPNAAPMPLTLATGGSLAIQGTLTPAGPGDLEDRFAVQLGDPAAPPAADGAAGPTHQLAVELTPAPTLATTVLVRDAAGKLLATSTAAGGQRHGFPNLATGATGQFAVTVKRAGKTGGKPEDGGYALVLRSSPLGPGDEHEPNDDLASATPIGPAHSEPQVAGYLGTRGDQDLFRVPLGEVAEGSVLQLDLDTPPEVVASLAVLDAQGKRLCGVKGRKGERLGLRNLEPLRLVGGVGAPAAGAAFHVLVRAEGPGDLTRRYVLGVRSEPAGDREREPNDDVARPSPLGQENRASGHLPPGDVDTYRIEAPPAAAVLELQPPPRLDLSLELATPGGGWTRVERAGRGQPERSPVAPGAPVLVRVVGKRPTDGELDASYRLSLVPGEPAGAPPP
jgi:hypothetical protein